MKNIILFTYLPSGGGAEYVFREFLKKLSNKKNILFVTIFDNTSDQYIIKNHIALIKKKPKNKFIKIFYYVKSIFNYLKILRKFQPDLVISTLTLPNIINIFTGLFFLKTKIKVREASSPISFINLSCNSNLKRFLKTLPYKFFSLSDEVIVLSKSARNQILKLNNNLNTKIIFNPIVANKKNEKIELNKNLKDFTNLIFVGRFVESKKPMFALNIIKDLSKEYKLSLCGDGPLLSEMKSYVEKFDLSQKVDFLGYTSNEKINSIMRNKCIYLSTSLYEGMSNALISAMCNNCPIVAFSAPGVRDQLEEGKWGLLFDQFDTKVVINLIKKIRSSQITHNQTNTKFCVSRDSYNIDNILNLYLS